MFNCDFVTFPCGIQGKVWYLFLWFQIFAVFLTFIVFSLMENDIGHKRIQGRYILEYGISNMDMSYPPHSNCLLAICTLNLYNSMEKSK